MSGVLEGRTALVTGGASGIGRACVQRFAAEGATVHVADLRRSDVPGTTSVEAFGVHISALCAGFVDTPLVTADVRPLIEAMELPMITPATVADAAMHALALRVNGAQWIVWGDTLMQYPHPALDLQRGSTPA
jgi:NAD(P)-dependent dehydrogenase (short-subunit alcohol dehydrogenase family)